VTGGGKTEFSIPTCAKDAIAFQYLRGANLGGESAGGEVFSIKR
jgi:hypothetical protein